MSTAMCRNAPHHMKVDEFIAWADDGRWQLIDGEPRAMAPASATHGISSRQGLRSYSIGISTIAAIAVSP